MVEYTNNWSSFSESSLIEPFLTAPDSLSNCGFKWKSSMNYITDLNLIPVFEDNILTDGFAPGFTINIDTDHIEDQSERSAKELELHFILRDKSIHKFFKIASKPLESLPKNYDVPSSAIDSLCGAHGLDFGIIITPKRGVTYAEGLANNPGHILAQKIFKLSPPKSSAGFPVEFEIPDEFEEGISKKAVWYIRWYSTDKIREEDAEAEDILRVVYNKNCSDKLFHMPKSNIAGKLYWSENTIEVFLEIASVVLVQQEIDPKSKGKGFYPSLLRSIEKITNRPVSETIDEFRRSEASATSKLRASLYETLGTSKTIEKNNFGS